MSLHISDYLHTFALEIQYEVRVEAALFGMINFEAKGRLEPGKPCIVELWPPAGDKGIRQWTSEQVWEGITSRWPTGHDRPHAIGLPDASNSLKTTASFRIETGDLIEELAEHFTRWLRKLGATFGTVDGITCVHTPRIQPRFGILEVSLTEFLQLVAEKSALGMPA
ncbi:hypothetical protein HY375_02865 [Candidatus Berkelbacteria bacterium]|nr:hypothetical protein [Candidatus Berkelbacteria bacterium]